MNAKLKKADIGREVRYSSPDGHTVHLGKVVGVEDGFLLVDFHTRVLPVDRNRDKTMKGNDPVRVDPANLEFV